MISSPSPPNASIAYSKYCQPSFLKNNVILFFIDCFRPFFYKWTLSKKYQKEKQFCLCCNCSVYVAKNGNKAAKEVWAKISRIVYALVLKLKKLNFTDEGHGTYGENQLIFTLKAIKQLAAL